MIYLFDELDRLTDSEYALAYEMLFDERKKKTARYRFEKDKRLSTFAYALLLFGLKNEGRLVERCPEFGCHQYGKPYFLSEKLSNVFFNFSHCSEGILCGISDGEIGVDIEGYVQDVERIKDLVLHPNEQKLFADGKNSSILFTQVWTIKEAYTKMKGCGLVTEITDLDFSDFLNRREYADGCLITQQYDRYVVSAFGKAQAVCEIKRVSAQELAEFIKSM
jgi:4'-phosphopantetheinyl transferase